MTPFKSYLLGFALSVGLTLVAYFIVAEKMLTGSILIIVILSLAIIQLWVQLIMFLHIGEEAGPRYRLASWISTALLILVVVIGSIWIMDNLSYHMPTDEQIMKEEGIYR